MATPPLAKLERLAASGIRILPVLEMQGYLVLERGGYASLVERTGDGFCRPCAAWRLTEQGISMLVWRGQEAYFVLKGDEYRATPEEVRELRRFAADLDSALQ